MWFGLTAPYTEQKYVSMCLVTVQNVYMRIPGWGRVDLVLSQHFNDINGGCEENPWMKE